MSGTDLLPQFAEFTPEIRDLSPKLIVSVTITTAITISVEIRKKAVAMLSSNGPCPLGDIADGDSPVSYTHLRAHET